MYHAIQVKEGLESSLLALAQAIHSSVSTLFRVVGRVEGALELLRLEKGTLRILASDLSPGGGGASAELLPVEVAVDCIDVTDVGCDDAAETGVGFEAAIKRFTVKLLQAVAEAQSTATAVNLHLSFDPEALWQGFGEEEDADNDFDVSDPPDGAQQQGSRPSSPLHEPGQEEEEDPYDGPEHIAY
jgi:hypothetical protein